jgi:hypothetical protein
MNTIAPDYVKCACDGLHGRRQRTESAMHMTDCSIVAQVPAAGSQQDAGFQQGCWGLSELPGGNGNAASDAAD